MHRRVCPELIRAIGTYNRSGRKPESGMMPRSTHELYYGGDSGRWASDDIGPDPHLAYTRLYGSQRFRGQTALTGSVGQLPLRKFAAALAGRVTI